MRSRYRFGEVAAEQTGGQAESAQEFGRTEESGWLIVSILSSLERYATERFRRSSGMNGISLNLSEALFNHAHPFQAVRGFEQMKCLAASAEFEERPSNTEKEER